MLVVYTNASIRTFRCKPEGSTATYWPQRLAIIYGLLRGEQVVLLFAVAVGAPAGSATVTLQAVTAPASLGAGLIADFADVEEATGRAKGGIARAQKLSEEERKAIARRAAAARWGTGKLPRATHKGVLHISDIELPCFVLEDGRRVLSGRGITKAIGMKGRGQGTARIASLLRQKSNETKDLAVAIERPLVFESGAPLPTARV